MLVSKLQAVTYWRSRPHTSFSNIAIVRAIEARPSFQFAFLALFAFTIRAPIFGEWSFDVDDQFYSLVGRKILDGATMYVDIWDRKGPVLYLMFAAIAAISPSAAAYHVAATIFAVLGAWGICSIGRSVGTGARGSLMAGIAYLALLGEFAGASAQTPVFYNTLMIGTAWAIITRLGILAQGRIDLRVAAGMVMAGLAIGIKQSAAIESAFFGAFVIAQLIMARTAPKHLAAIIALLGLLGAAPYLIAGFWYWHIDHFQDLWHALVNSNFQRIYETPFVRLASFVILIAKLCLSAASACMGLLALRERLGFTAATCFLTGWTMTAIVAVAAFPNIYIHYALPLLCPLCIVSAEFFDTRNLGKPLFAATLVIALVFAGSFDLPTRIRNHRAQRDLTAYVAEETPTKKLLVWGKPSFLYAQIDALPPTALVFPPHLYDQNESGASGVDEAGEVRRIIASQPETVVMQTNLLHQRTNLRTTPQVRAYLRRCTRQKRFIIYDHEGPIEQIVHSRCAQT